MKQNKSKDSGKAHLSSKVIFLEIWFSLTIKFHKLKEKEYYRGEDVGNSSVLLDREREREEKRKGYREETGSTTQEPTKL